MQIVMASRDKIRRLLVIEVVVVRKATPTRTSKTLTRTLRKMTPRKMTSQRQLMVSPFPKWRQFYSECLSV